MNERRLLHGRPTSRHVRSMPPPRPTGSADLRSDAANMSAKRLRPLMPSLSTTRRQRSLPAFVDRRQRADGRVRAGGGAAGDVAEHPEYEQAGRDLRLGDQLRAIRRSRNLTQKEVAARAGISQPALSRIELGGDVPDIETLRRLGSAMGARFHVIVGDAEAGQEENLLVS